MPDLVVDTAFTSSDKITGTFGHMGKGADKFGGAASAAFRRAGKSASRFEDIVKGILVTDVIKGSLRELKTALIEVSGEFISYDAAIVGAEAKFKGLDTTTQKGAKTLEAMKLQARELGATTEFTATQAAKGLEFLAMAGASAEQAMAVLPGVVDLATSAGVDLARATDIATDSLGAFNLTTKDTAQLTKNMARINDVFAKTTTTANTSMEALFESVVKGGPAFTAAGQKLETFAAFTGVLADSGVKGGEAGTQLKNMMLRLAGPTDVAGKLLDKLGVKVKDGDGNFRDAVEIIADFEKGLEGMGSAQKTAALSTIFGTRSVTGMTILLNKGSEALRDYRGEIVASGDASKTMADKIRQSLGNQLASLKSASIELGFQFIDTFKGKIGPAIQTVTQFIRGIDVAAIVGQFQQIIDVGMKFRGVLIGLAVGWTIFRVAMAGAAIFEAIKFYMQFARALQITAGAQGLLNAVMIANPIGAIAVGIGLLIGGMILLADNFDVVSEAFISAMKFIGQAALDLFDFLMGPFRLLSSVFSTIADKVFGNSSIEAAAGATGDTTVVVADNNGDGSAVEPPNRQSLRAQQVQLRGRIDINGAPPGSTAEAETSGAPPIDMVMAGGA